MRAGRQNLNFPIVQLDAEDDGEPFHIGVFPMA
jgi:hypothetical protein